MKYISLTILFFLLGAFEPIKSDSLDNHFEKITSKGGLTALCESEPYIDECSKAIGEWKPKQLERVKTKSLFCIENCQLDTFGFVQTSNGQKEYPLVVTKDFDPSHPSKGIEFKLFPVAMNIHKYEGCAGCPHIKSFPISARLVTLKNEIVELPLIARGTFYLPKKFRDEAFICSRKDCELSVEADFVKKKVTKSISKKSVLAYSDMLKALNYHLVR